VKTLIKVSLGILTSVGGYLEAGSIGTALQAGARFRFGLLWAIAFGTICLAFVSEMSGRLAAISKHTVVTAIRRRFGIRFQIWQLGLQSVVDVFVLASEIGGAAYALQLLTGISFRLWALPVALLIWGLLWRATFGAIEHSVAILGLVTLCFVVAAYRLHPEWRLVERGFLPHRPPSMIPQYIYLAVAILGATISPYLVTFYSSGAVEEKWTRNDLGANRLTAGFGFAFGSTISMAVVVVAALVLAPRGVVVDSFDKAAHVLDAVFGRWGLPLFVASLAIGCVGAALELALDLAYISAQCLGWNWSENQRPKDEARFAMIYTIAIVIAVLPSLAGLDPLQLTMFSMVLTVFALPFAVGPLVALMNDRDYLKTHTNGWISNIAVTTVLAIAFALALIAIPAQLMGGQ
jgi:Mn2+/Fe2+ NRAMP family transporter